MREQYSTCAFCDSLITSKWEKESSKGQTVTGVVNSFERNKFEQRSEKAINSSIIFTTSHVHQRQARECSMVITDTCSGQQLQKRCCLCVKIG